VQAKAATDTLQSLRLTVAAAAGYGTLISVKNILAISNQKIKCNAKHTLLPVGFAID
jgi:hypothetical protein